MAPDRRDVQPAVRSAAHHDVFVYGTLLPGMANAAVANAAGLLAVREAVVAGVRLYHLEPEGYPALVPGRGREYGRVHGAVLTVRDLAPLDALEGLDLAPPLYERRRWPLVGGGEAWIYLYARPDRLRAAGAAAVPGGRWRPTGSTRPDAPDGST